MTREGKSGGTQPRESNIASIKLELAKAGLDLTGKASATRRTGTQTSPEIQSAKRQLSSAVAGCDRTAQQSGISPESKAVYRRLSNILQIAKKKIGDDFSADNIATALSSALKARTDLSTAGGTGEVGMYDPDADGTEKQGTNKRTERGVEAPYAWRKNSAGEYDPVEEGQKECLTSLGKAGISAVVGAESRSLKEVLEGSLPTLQIHKQNPKSKFAEVSEDKLSEHKYTFSEGEKTATYTWDPIFKPKDFAGQLDYESNTFSGKVTIHRLEPGTVLVRVFGAGQSVKTACWARLDDDSSSVTCAQDLYKKLAVKAEWNGDGNLGVFIVPKDAKIWVAEGKIASQAEKYTADVGEGDYDGRKESTFLYEGGGTQVNILTPDAASTFAGVDPKIFDRCMFCFRDDGIVKEEQFGRPHKQFTERQTITQGE